MDWPMYDNVFFFPSPLFRLYLFLTRAPFGQSRLIHDDALSSS